MKRNRPASATSIACFLLLAACSPAGTGTPPSSESQPSPPTQSLSGSLAGGEAEASISVPPAAYTVASLLEHRPAFGESVLLDAHLTDYMAGPGRGRFAGPCESIEFAPLFDEPVAAQFTLFGRTNSVMPPGGLPRVFPLDLRPRDEDDAWTPLPAHGRFRGHLLGRTPETDATPTRPLSPTDTQAQSLDTEGLRACPNADRIFVIEEVVEVFEADSRWHPEPPEPQDWQPVRLVSAGLTARQPPGWEAEIDEAAREIRLRSGAEEGAEVHILVHDDPDGSVLAGKRDKLDLWNELERQHASTHHAVAPDTPPLDFEIRTCGERIPTCIHAFHVDGTQLVEIASDLPNEIHRARHYTAPFQAVFHSIVLDSTPRKTATPPIRTTIGDGPFLSREEAEALARELIPDGEAWTIAPGRLVDEATARAEAAAVGCDIDGTVGGLPGTDQRAHPEAVWALRTGGLWEGEALDYLTLVDAKTRYHLCTKALEAEGPSPVETPVVDREHLERSLHEDEHPLALDISAAFNGTRQGIPSLREVLLDPLLLVFVHELAGSRGGMFQWVLHIAPQLGPTAVCGGGCCVVEGRDGKAFACPSEAVGCTQLDGPSRCRLEHEGLRCRRLDPALGWDPLTPRERCIPGPCLVTESETERFVLLDGRGLPTEWPPGVDRLIVESSTMPAENGSLVRVGIVQLSSVPAVLGLGLSESD